MRTKALLLIAAVVSTALAVSGPAGAGETPQVVVALIDTGINPYNPEFRDDSALAQLPPSAYLPDYPPDCAGIPAEATDACAVRLDLAGLSAGDYATAYETDRPLWEDIVNRPCMFGDDGRHCQVYYVPGTKIVGLIWAGSGGVRCHRRVQGVELPFYIPPPGGTLNASALCPERPLLDDFGHGTMTSSRATGNTHSLAPSARVVMIEGLGAQNSAWAADQPWIDVQSNSWGSAVPAPADAADMNTFERIAQQHLVFVASGNGVGFSGVAPTPTQLNGLGAAGVVLVGGHDNGRVTAWSGTPAHVVTDAYGGWTAIHDSFAVRPDPMACCTSAASPYAAGGGAAILLEARRILSDTRTGVHAGIAASGPAGLVPSGPLADGIFTLDEWREVVTHTSQARPVEGRDDGLLNFIGGPGVPANPEHGAGENPFCQFCFTLPIEWKNVPVEAPGYTNIGYGAVNEFSAALAADVLRGSAPLPARPEVDEWFDHVDDTRDLLWNRP